MKIIQAVLAVAFAAVASASDANDNEYLRGPSADVAAAVTADVAVEDDIPRPVVVDKVFPTVFAIRVVSLSDLTHG